ncbi:succinylglutamate desuccinylase/aspartoacylase family protein [Winogradskyella tangerina]|uniref:succinylglutamate desuccinylase/aspartoacylase family protein n=1 Tax=Winogradskyella tangerina TaxID=2023240 RepID=UPI000DBE03B1|nr:succinylglutamate desuccinylase/aspartoacylase family protein [Winogradskyella tangerina]
MQISLRNDTKHMSESDRVFHHIRGKKPGATIVFFAGIHGNEFAGVDALNSVLSNLDEANISGEIIGVYGNIQALKENRRFIEKDLNRLWTTNQLQELKNEKNPTHELLEQRDIFKFIEGLLASTDRPIYFIDLHTTSSQSLPFITINDAMINRKFSSCFGIPVVLGIEEYLEGPLLSYLNTLGYVSLGFESGQHIDPAAIKNCEAFVFLALWHTGILKQPNEEKIQHYESLLKSATKDINSTFEVVYKYHIQPEEDFKMLNGFESFQYVKKGTHLANSDGKAIYSDYSAKLFMPLYQKTGSDGFFIIRHIPKFFLKLSQFLRRIKADQLLTYLPGITWHNKTQGVLKANLRVARFLTKSIFHLFGYRNKQIDQTHLLLYNRERVARKKMYRNEKWY